PEPSTPHFSPLSLHDALPISRSVLSRTYISLSIFTVSATGCSAAAASLFRFNLDTGFFIVDSQCGAQSSSPVLAHWQWFLAIALDRKSTRLNSSHVAISYAVF